MKSSDLKVKSSDSQMKNSDLQTRSRYRFERKAVYIIKTFSIILTVTLVFLLLACWYEAKSLTAGQSERFEYRMNLNEDVDKWGLENDDSIGQNQNDIPKNGTEDED